MSDDAIKTFEHAGCTVEIFTDYDTESPRNWDNVGKLVCFHKRHNLGDKHSYKADDYNGWEAFKAAILRDYEVLNDRVAVILPVFLYDHSGLRIKVGSFQGHLAQGHAEFDSGQVGFIFCTVKQVADEWNGDIEKATKYLTGEIETYDQFLRGDVYVYDVKHGDLQESCGGCYGLDYCEQQARETAEHLAARAAREQLDALQCELAFFN